MKYQGKCNENKIKLFKYRTVFTVMLVSAKNKIEHWYPGEVLILDCHFTENGIWRRKFTGWTDSFSKSIVAPCHLTILQFYPVGHNFLCKVCASFWFPPSSSHLCLPFPLHLPSARIMHQFDSVINYSKVRKWASLEVIQHLLDLFLEIRENVFL